MIENRIFQNRRLEYHAMVATIARSNGLCIVYMQGTCWRLGSSYFPLTTSIEVTTHERKPSKQQERQK